jgi:hypothetical protein
MIELTSFGRRCVIFPETYVSIQVLFPIMRLELESW